MATRHQHKFQRLSDEAIFCACGEIRSASSERYCTRPHYQPTWIWVDPYTPTVPNRWPTITTGGTSPYPDDNTTITYSA